MRQAAKVYLETQVTTTSQGQVLIMLYDGAIKFLSLAKERMAAKDYAGKGKLISNAIDIINELASSLNAEKGGDLAANLSQLYFYCNKRLFMANSRMDPAGIDEVIKILGGIRSAYAQIVDSPEAVAAMAKAPPPASPQQRTPVGVQAGPTTGAPIPTARAHGAYATQGATVAPDTLEAAPDGQAEETGPEEPVATRETAMLEIPTAEAQPEPPAETALEPPALETDMPPLTTNKRLAASNLYRKFAS